MRNILNSLLEMGKYSLKQRGIDTSDILQILVENPNSNSQYNDVICLVLQKEGTKFRLDEIKMEKFDSGKIAKYFYKSGPPSGSDYSLTSKVTSPEKTVVRLGRWVKKAVESSRNLTDEEENMLKNLQSVFDNEGNALITEVEERCQNISGNAILIVKIAEHGQEKYVGEVDLFRKIFRNRNTENIQKVSVDNGICSACGERKDRIYGKQTPYKFYTVDKPGYISGLIEDDCWKNFPLCEDCMLILEEGKTYIEKNLNFRFYGFNYYIFPNLILDNEKAREEVNEILKLLAEKQIKMKDAKRVIGEEDEILNSLKEFKDYLCYDFFFLSKEQSAERILLTIEGVLPSRLRTIFDAKTATDKRFGDKFLFHFGRIRTFLAKSDEGKRNYDLDKYFLEITNKIFTGLSIEPGFIIQMYMKKIRRDFANLDSNSDRFFYDTKDAIVSLDFIRELGVIQFEEEDTMEISAEFEEFFKKYGQTFNTTVKKGIFLLGSLTQSLLEKQQRDRSSMPFYKQLKGLRMAERDIKGLLPKVQNKMEEYEYFTRMPKAIAHNISAYLMSAGENWSLNIDEINFYFSAGMNMKNEVYDYLGGEKDE